MVHTELSWPARGGCSETAPKDGIDDGSGTTQNAWFKRPLETLIPNHTALPEALVGRPAFILIV